MEDILISLLPVIIIVIIWIVIMRIVVKKGFKNNKHTENQDEMIVLLREIKDELKQLNKKDTSK